MMTNVIIHPEIEPGVINNAMLISCVLEQGPTEEAGRLFAEEGVHLEEEKVVKLEFQKILRIDHLFMLKSVTSLTLSHNLIEKIENLDALHGLIELDLSFNKIEKIEKLEALVNIEVLSLFHNKIHKIENLESQTKLLIFSIGDNLIEDYKEAIYLRKFRFLRCVSFKGNPCCDDVMTNLFLKSALWRVTYLDYMKITEEERQEGKASFRALLRKLDEVDEVSEKERIAREEYQAKVELYALSFVEYLSGSEHYETMFERDPDGLLCLEVGGEINEYYDNYRNGYVETMSELVVFAQEQYNVREAEVKAFKEIVNAALDISVAKSKEIIEDYYEQKQDMMDRLQNMIEVFESKEATLEELEPKFVVLVDQFNELLNNVWKKLMKEEIGLFEQAEETRVQFAVNLTELVNKLLEVARNSFGLWREYECLWTIKVSEALTKLIGNTLLLGDASPELLEMLSERDYMMNTVATSTDNHARFIDVRENLLIHRANQWKDDLIANTNNNEIKRNRERILEINYFLDNERIEWAEMQMNLAEPPPDPETAALLADDY